MYLLPATRPRRAIAAAARQGRATSKACGDPRRAAVPMEERDILAPVDAALKLFAVNDAATQTASRKLMVKALRNLEREPSNEKFRKLRVANKVVQAKIINARGAQQLMACGGFYTRASSSRR